MFNQNKQQFRTQGNLLNATLNFFSFIVKVVTYEIFSKFHRIIGPRWRRILNIDNNSQQFPADLGVILTKRRLTLIKRRVVFYLQTLTTNVNNKH